jgi:hypothetical protein
MKKVFGFNGGYQIRNIEPQIAGEVLESIKEETGVLNADVVVEKAKDIENPLHNYFEWDDSKAANEFRLTQANYLIRSIKVEIIQENKPNVEIKRAFTNIKEVENKGYMLTEDILKDTQLSFLMLKQAHKELMDWKERYKNLLELSEVFDYINNYLGQLKSA